MNLNSSGFKLPVYIAKSVATSGHIADLAPLAIGIFDKKTNYVATAVGNGKEFLLAGGSPHTKDKLSKFYHGMQHRKESTPFYGKDIESFEKAYPTRPTSEQWVIGYGGGKDDITLKFEKNKTYKLKIRLYGEAIYRAYNRSVEKVIPLTTAVCDGNDCDYNCADELMGAKTQTLAWVKAINSNVEFQDLKFKAYPVFSDYASTSASVNDYTLTVADAGTADSLQDVQRAYPTAKIKRVSYTKGISVYVMKAQSGAPANYTPKSFGSYIVDCVSCLPGYTYAAGYNTYIVKRPVASTTDLDDSGARTTYAASIVTAYGGVTGSGLFLGIDEGSAIVKFSSTAVETPLLSDVFIGDVTVVPATCNLTTGPSAIAWVVGDGYYTVTRTLKVTVSNEDCKNAGSVADLQNALSYLKNTVVVTEITDTTGTGIDRDNCTQVFQVVQTSFPMKDEYCMTKDNAKFEDLYSYKGSEFIEVVGGAEAYSATVKTGIRFVAPFFSEAFSDFSYELGEYYDASPVRMEVTVYEEEFDMCKFGDIAQPRRVVAPKYQRLFGEWVLEMYINRNRHYFPYMDWSDTTRWREVIDTNALAQVDRKAYYVVYFLKYKEARDAHNFNQKQQHWEPMIFVEESDKATQAALEAALLSVTAKFDVELVNRGSY